MLERLKPELRPGGDTDEQTSGATVSTCRSFRAVHHNRQLVLVFLNVLVQDKLKDTNRTLSVRPSVHQTPIMVHESKRNKGGRKGPFPETLVSWSSPSGTHLSHLRGGVDQVPHVSVELIFSPVSRRVTGSSNHKAVGETGAERNGWF